MENTNGTPDPQDGDSLDSEAIDPDELLAAAAAIKEGPTEYMTTDDFSSDGPHAAPPGYGATPPPPPASTLVENRLTRDPFATLGGVLSGLAHRYGWDVAITRIAFGVLFLLSAGTALLAYVLAWIIIPRAQYWPPVQRQTPQISGRDLGIALLALAGIITLGVGSGRFAGVIVPLALVGGGIWLLSQNPRAEAAPAVAGSAGAGSVGSAGGPLPPADFSRPPSPPAFEPQRVPKRSRKSRAVIGVGVLCLLALPVLAIGGAITALALTSSESSWEFDGSESTFYGFDSADDIPATISADDGELIVDLSQVDFSAIEGDGDRIDLDVSLDFGKLEVILPEDVRVNIDAEADLVGQVASFGQENSGLRPDLSISSDNAQLDLDLEVGVGEVQVIRVDS